MADKSMLFYSAIAGADHTGKEKCFVTINGAVSGLPQVALTAAAAQAHGVIIRGDASGKVERIARSGIVEMKAGAAIAAGAEVEANAASFAITKSAGIALGIALAAAGALNDVIPVYLYCK